MDHRRASVQFLHSTGLIPIELNEKDKNPAKGFSFVGLENTNITIATKRILDNPDMNFGAIFHDRFIDVDVDSFEKTLRDALDMMLPPTRFVWGRVSKPRSHRIYQLEQPFERPLYTKVLGLIDSIKILDTPYRVEIRNDTIQKAMYTVLPGSFIDMGKKRNKEKGYNPEGEAIKWEGGVDTSESLPVVDFKDLTNKIRMAQAVAILSPYWTEGRRNDMSLALSGLLWRIRMASISINDIIKEGVDEEEFVIDVNQGIELLKAVCRLSDDDPGDLNSRVLNFRNTWKKLDSDPEAKITGGRAMADIIGEPAGTAIVNALYKLLSDNESLLELEEACANFVKWYGTDCIIDLKMVKAGIGTPYMRRQAAVASLEDFKVKIGDGRVALGRIIYGVKLVEKVYGFDFDPSFSSIITEKDGFKMINQWRGFAVEPDSESPSIEYMQPMLYHIYTLLANGDHELGDWILGWMAHIIQTPSTKSRTALVLVGPHGAGKTWVADNILIPIIGPSHSASIKNIDEITGQFNMLLDNKILIAANESIHQNKYVSAQALKTLITDNTMSIEPKNVNRYEKPNLLRFLITSNRENDAVYIDSTPYERRFTVAHVSHAKAGTAHTEFWNTYLAWCRNNISKIMRFLLDYKFDSSFISIPYLTAAKASMQSSAISVELSWIISRILEGHILSSSCHEHWFEAYSKDISGDDKRNNRLDRTKWPSYFMWEAIEEDLRQYSKSWGRPIFNNNPKMIIRDLLPKLDVKPSHQSEVTYRVKDGTQHKKRIRLYTLPSRDKIIFHLKNYYGDKLIDHLLAGYEPDEELVETGKDEKENF